MKMKRRSFVSFLIVLTMMLSLIPVLASCNGQLRKPDANTIYVLSQQGLMSQTVIQDFQAANPGVTVRVYYYNTEQELHHILTQGNQRFDIITPSLSMVQYLRDQQLLENMNALGFPLTIPGAESIHDRYINRISPFFNNATFNNVLRQGTGAASQYFAIGYTWGVMGILYNADMLRSQIGQPAMAAFSANPTWDILFDQSLRNQVFMSPCMRETFAIAAFQNDSMRPTQDILDFSRNPLAHNHLRSLEHTLNNQRRQVRPDFATSSARSVAAFQTAQAANAPEVLRPMAQGARASTVVEQMARGDRAAALVRSGQAYMAMVHASPNVNLSFAAPEQNFLFFNTLAIPRYADYTRDLQKNSRLISFIGFMMQEPNFIRTMEETGYTSVFNGTNIGVNTLTLPTANRTFNFLRGAPRSQDPEYAAGRRRANQISPVDRDVLYFFSTTTGYFTVDGHPREGEPVDLVANVSSIMLPERALLEGAGRLVNINTATRATFASAWDGIYGVNVMAIVFISLAAVLVLAAAAAIFIKYKDKIFKKRK